MSMLRSTDTILDHNRTREVTGVFHSRRTLDDAAQDLLLSGFDRSDIDLSAFPDEVQRRLNYAVIPPADLADIPITPRQPFFGDDDLLGAEAVASSVLGCIAAVGSALFLILKGYEAMAVAMWSILIGISTGALVIVPIYRLLRRERARGPAVSELLERGKARGGGGGGLGRPGLLSRGGSGGQLAFLE